MGNLWGPFVAGVVLFALALSCSLIMAFVRDRDRERRLALDRQRFADAIPGMARFLAGASRYTVADWTKILTDFWEAGVTLDETRELIGAFPGLFRMNSAGVPNGEPAVLGPVPVVQVGDPGA